MTEQSSAASTESRQDSWAVLVERVSQELEGVNVKHHVSKKPADTLDRNIGGITSFSSVRNLAAALERADADFSYSADSGFVLYHRETR